MKSDFDFFDPNDAAVDLTSLIDVLFLLLTFFILAATFVSPGINVMLSKAKTAEASSTNSEQVIFSIDENGYLYHSKDKINKDEIAAVLKSLPEETQIVFNVDVKAPFNAFLETMDEVKFLGFSKFIINAEPYRE